MATEKAREIVRVAWLDAIAVAGHLFERVPNLYPPRYRAAGFPGYRHVEQTANQGSELASAAMRVIYSARFRSSLQAALDERSAAITCGRPLVATSSSVHIAVAGAFVDERERAGAATLSSQTRRFTKRPAQLLCHWLGLATRTTQAHCTGEDESAKVGRRHERERQVLAPSHPIRPTGPAHPSGPNDPEESTRVRRWQLAHWNTMEQVGTGHRRV
jgi:hypothetical protein